MTCPMCHGDGVLDCPGGCDGDDRRCLTCAGSSPRRCVCNGGEVADVTFCPCCLEEAEVSFGRHPLFLQAQLEQLHEEGRFTLRECVAKVCAYCQPLAGVGL